MVKVKEDLTGRQFGRLIVLYQTEDYVTPQGKHHSRWHCVCECGKECDVIGSQLKNESVKSCGCWQHDFLKKQNKYRIKNNIVYIYFNNCDEYTIVNLDKWNEIPWIKEFCWWKNIGGYAYAKIPSRYRKFFNNKTHIFLHQLICPCENGFEPDHLDRNRLNNLTQNLKPKTRIENSQNRGFDSNNSSGHIGVNWDSTKMQWRSRITVNRKTIELGYFNNMENAIQAYKDAKSKYHIT